MLTDLDRISYRIGYARPVVSSHFSTPTELKELNLLWENRLVDVLSWNLMQAPYADHNHETVNALLRSPGGIYFANVVLREGFGR